MKTPARRSRVYLNLFWTVPLALFLGSYLAFIARVSRCGIGQECRDAAGGWAAPAAPSAFNAATSAWFFLTLAILAVPWTRSWRLRTLVAVAAGLLFAGLSLWYVLFLPGKEN